jgi:lysophospholipase
MGFSLGAAVAMTLIAKQGGVHSLIGVSAPIAFDEIEKDLFTIEAMKTGIHGLEPGAGVRPGQFWLEKERPIDAIARLSPTPVLLIHGTDDPTTYHRHSEQLYQAAGEPKRLELIERGGHAQEIYRRFPDRFVRLVQEWLKHTLLDATLTDGSLIHASGYFKTRRGPALFYQQWTIPKTQALVVIVHGAGEHSSRYQPTARRLNDDGYAVYAFDLPGQGRSPGIRGHIRRFDDYLSDLDDFLRFIAPQAAEHRPILVGHSFGGLVSTYYALLHPEAIAGLVCSSPLWDLALVVPRWKQILAHALAPLWPSLTLSRPLIGAEMLSHDPEAQAQYLHDPLIHGKTSVRLYVELRRRFAQLPQLIGRLSMPVLVLQAGEDRVVSVEATKTLFALIGASQKRLIVYEGYCHELFNEVGRDVVWRDLVAWLQGTRY